MDAHPRIEIGNWPTPVVRLDRTSELLGTDVWAKLEDRCGIWGGNKVRKLEYILARAQADGVRRLIGFGAGTSNWTSALAFHAARQGFEVEVRLSNNEVPDAYARLYEATGTRIVRSSAARWYAEAEVARLRRDRGCDRYLPLGGSDMDGTVGSCNAGIELADEVREAALPRPAAVFVAAGTAGTAAGVAVGAEIGGLGLDVVCVRVVARPYATRAHVGLIARALRRRLGMTAAAYRLHGDGNFAAPGYARPNPASLEAAQIAALDGLVLDQTYGAKAFAALVAHARNRPGGTLLFLHTSPGDPPAAVDRR